MQRGVLGVVSALVLVVYVIAAHSGFWESLTPAASENYYNRLVDGFRAGQLSLKKDVPPGLTQLADPYDPVANAHYRGAFYQLYDLSYYKGRLYLYFGVTPALILFWPAVALTGRYMLYRQAVAVFCGLGYLASLGVLIAMWRRYFAAVSVSIITLAALGLGLASNAPVLLSRCSVYEVAISCGSMLTMMSLAAIWGALHQPERRVRWVILASLAYGLALGARPSLLFGAIILLVPAVQARQQQWRAWPLVVGAIGPVMLAGLGLLLYNKLRFDNPFDFGLHYQLAGERQDARQVLGFSYLGWNLHDYLFERVRWRSHFPFVTEISVLPLRPGRGSAESAFGTLIYFPIVWLALAAPLAWRHRSAGERSLLRAFLGAVAASAGTCVLAVSLFFGKSIRYESDFLPEMVLLAVVGIVALERTLAGQPTRRRVARGAWGALLGFSITFNLLAGVEHYAASCDLLGMTLAELGRTDEAREQFGQALRIDPGYASAYNNLGLLSMQAGEFPQAIQQYEQAVRLDPDLVEARYGLANALARTHRLDQAMHQYQEALRLQPDNRDAHFNVGELLFSVGRIREAVEQYEQALRIDPGYAEAHERLGNALARTGDIQGAVAQFAEALRIQPNSAEAHSGLANTLVLEGHLDEAINHYEQALRVDPISATTHYNLGAALERSGRIPEAIAEYKRALDLKSGLVAARDALRRLRADQ